MNAIAQKYEDWSHFMERAYQFEEILIFFLLLQKGQVEGTCGTDEVWVK